MTPLEFCIHALRTNSKAPCDQETANIAEEELKALRDDRATIDAMTTLLGEARSERDALKARVAELEDGSFAKRQGATLETYRIERNEARATLAQRDREVLALRSALEASRAAVRDSCHAVAIYGDKPPAMYLEALGKAFDALASTAQAGAEAERGVLEAAWGRVCFHLRDTGEAANLEFQGIKAAILGTEPHP